MNSLLNHTCTMVTRTEAETQDDSYGQTIFDDTETKNVACRYSRARETETVDDTGTVQRVDAKIFLEFDTTVALRSKIRDIKDSDGAAVVAGTFEVVGLIPAFDASVGHHKEVLVRRA